jgi:hypothetical protein
MTVAIATLTSFDDERDEDQHVNGTRMIAIGSTTKLAAMIHALRATSSTWELVADVANELTCREISSTSMITSLSQKNSPLGSQNCAFPDLSAFTLFTTKTSQQLQHTQQKEDDEGRSDADNGDKLVSSAAAAEDTICLTSFVPTVAPISASSAPTTSSPPLKHKNETSRYSALHTNCASLLLGTELFMEASCKCVDPTKTSKDMSREASKHPMRTVVQRNFNV